MTASMPGSKSWAKSWFFPPGFPPPPPVVDAGAGGPEAAGFDVVGDFGGAAEGGGEVVFVESVQGDQPESVAALGRAK